MSQILLIEDNQNNADYIIRILKSAGHDVEHYTEGLAGARAARDIKPDLVLLDFNLPDIDGNTLILSMKRSLGGASSPPFIAITARVSDMDRRIAALFGFDAFISKPFEPEELLTVIADFFNSENK